MGCEDLYNDNDTGEIENQFEREPPPLRSEVAGAIGENAKGKSAGPDDVPVDAKTVLLRGTCTNEVQTPANSLISKMTTPMESS